MKLKNFILLNVLVIISFTSCKKIITKPSIAELRNISELAVLDCFYHTTAKIHKPAENVLKSDITEWYEFNLELKLGIDTSKIKMKINETNVFIELPPIQVIGKPYIVSDSIKCVSSVDGLLMTYLSPEEKLNVAKEATNDVIKKINEGDPALSKNAENRVKYIIEAYINQIGELSGVEYKVNWVSLDDNYSIETSAENKE